MTEDNQEIFNNTKILKKIFNSNRKSIPLNPKFNIFFTSRDVFLGSLSEAFKSRCTIIYCPNYDTEKYLSKELFPEENYKIICKSILKEETLTEILIDFNKKLLKKKKLK